MYMGLFGVFSYFGLTELIYACMADSMDALHSNATVAFKPMLYDNNVLINMNNKINFVKDNGDFIAHHSERFWKSSLNLNLKDLDHTTLIRLWVSDDEAKKSLIYTSEIISQLINTYYMVTKP